MISPRKETDANEHLLLDTPIFWVLGALERGFLYAKHLNCEASLFAAPISQLLGHGATLMDMRFLLLAGDIGTAETVDPNGRLTGAEHVYLTDSGFKKLQSLATHDRKMAAAAASSELPSWCEETRRLTIGDAVVKAYRVPSPNQINVLQVFQEEGWPLRIDDPLPPRPGVESKRRLVETIKSLNRSQKHARIRFFGDGTGAGVCWRYD